MTSSSRIHLPLFLALFLSPFYTVAQCTADFTYNTAGLTVAFTNISTGDYNAQFWDFGDLIGTSEANNPTYTYFTAGTYEVCLLVSDTNGGMCFDEICVDVEVTGGGGGGLCQAEYSYETSGLQIDMENESSGTFLTALYDYGDDSFPTFEESYTYEEPGEYEVCLTIFNPFPFCTDTYCEEIEIVDLTCEAVFTYSFNPETNAYSFQNITEVGDVTGVEWDFGDGNTSTFANPTYAYNEPGLYEVCLFTFDEENLCGEVCEEVEVYPLGVSGSQGSVVRLFPNPSDGNVTLDGMPAGNHTIIVRDITGRILMNVPTAESLARINLEVAAGTYLLDVLSEEGISIERFKVMVE